jgi:hypothetical protein
MKKMQTCNLKTNLAGHSENKIPLNLNAPLNLLLSTRDCYHNSLQIKSVLCMPACNRMYNRIPGFLIVVKFGSLLSFPLSRQKFVSHSQSSCVSLVELTDWRGWGGGGGLGEGKKPNHTTARKPGTL